MRIGIDARFLTHPQRGGFKTYSECLIAALAEVDSENEYILYLDRAPDPDTQLPRQPNFIPRIVSGQSSLIGMPRREQFGLARQAARDRLDLLHSLCLTAPLYLDCASVVTIHDMIWYFPEKFSNTKSWSPHRKLMEWYYRLVPRFAAHRASMIITVSEASKQSIVDNLRVPADRVFVTYEAASRIYRPQKDEQQIRAARKKYNLEAKFIFAIGSADPRKNLETLVRAYHQLSPDLQAEYQLVIVWTHSFLARRLTELIQKLALPHQIRFLAGVSDQDLVQLYNLSSLFVFPSLYEGFGLPLLEAMACGTPVVAADNSSIPEIVGDAALLCDAHDVQALADAMTRALTNQALRTCLRQKGFARVADMTWDRCARQTVNVYQQAFLKNGLGHVPWTPSKKMLLQKKGTHET